MAFAAARMIMKDKRPALVHPKRSSKEERSRSRSKARVKPVEGGVGKSGSGGPKTPTLTPKNNHQAKKGEKPPPKGSSVVQKPAVKQQKIPQSKNGNNGNGKKQQPGKKGQRHQTYDLLVTIDLRECGLTEDQVSEFKEAFMLCDKDEDGVVSLQELAIVLKALGQRPTDVELESMVGGLDEDGNGGIEFNDFLQAMGKRQKDEEGEEGLKEAFKVFDKDGDGMISSSELRHVMISLGEKLSPDEADEMLREADGDGDGLVNYFEFVSILTAKT